MFTAVPFHYFHNFFPEQTGVLLCVAREKMVQLTGWLLRKCPGPAKVWKKMQTFRTNAVRRCFKQAPLRYLLLITTATSSLHLLTTTTTNN